MMATNCLLFLVVVLFILTINSATLIKAISDDDKELVDKFDQLHKAIIADDVGHIEDVLERFFDKNHDSANATGYKPLHVAAFHGSKKAAEFFILKGANFLDTLIPGKEQPLHLAAFNGQLEMVDFLLKTGPVLMNATTATLTESEALNGETALFFACKSPKVESASIVKNLLEHGADIYHEDSRGNQPLHRAVMARNLQIVNVILEHDRKAGEASRTRQGGKTVSHLIAEFDLGGFVTSWYFNASSRDHYGQTPFCTAASHGSVEFARNYPDKRALNSGKCVYLNNHLNNNVTCSPLHVAAINRQFNYLEFMLDKDNGVSNLNVLEQDSSGGTALHAMIVTMVTGLGNTTSSNNNNQQGDQSIIDLLYRRNRRIIEAADFLGRTPFLTTALMSLPNFAEMLRLKFGAKTMAVDNRGYSALHLANDRKFASFLVEKMPHQRNEIDRPTYPAATMGSARLTGAASALIVAVAERKSLDLIDFLLSQNANKTAVNGDGQSVIHVAIEVGYLEALNVFLRQNFDFTLRDHSGRTALLYAIELGKIDVAKILLETDVAIGDRLVVDTMSDTLDTPLHLTARQNLLELAEILLRRKNLAAKPNIYGQTPLHEAVLNQHLEMVQILVANGAPVDAVDTFGRTPLHLAVPCTTLSLQIAHELTGENSSIVFEMANDFGQLPIHVAASHNCPDLVMFYLAMQNNSCSKMNRDGLTPLHMAKKLGYHTLLNLLVKSGKCHLKTVDNCGNDYLKIDVKKPRRCGPLPEIDNGQIEHPPNNYFCIGSTATIRCDIGYHVIGSNVVTCHLNGRWQLRGFCGVVNDCEDIQRAHPKAPSGVYRVTPRGGGHLDRPIEVYCDMKSLGGGWTVFQRRLDDSQDFYLNWTNYKTGFGELTANFWLGNDNIHRLAVYQRYYLLISMTSWDETQVGIAYYDGFFIEDESNAYRLRFNKFVCGNFNKGQDGLTHHNGMRFTTRDRDNDDSVSNCAQLYTGAWWYRNCYQSNLNGVHKGSSSGSICWDSTCTISLKRVVMMIRKTKLESC